MVAAGSVNTVGARPNEVMLYRCLVCGFNTLKPAEISEHLMGHAEAAKYVFSGVVND